MLSVTNPACELWNPKSVTLLTKLYEERDVELGFVNDIPKCKPVKSVSGQLGKSIAFQKEAVKRFFTVVLTRRWHWEPFVSEWYCYKLTIQKDVWVIISASVEGANC